VLHIQRQQQRMCRQPLSWAAVRATRSIIAAAAVVAAGAAETPELKALVFDCDGVILESEDLHRRAYNAAFEHFEVRVPAGTGDVVSWSSEYYDDLQNRVGGGKPKMRHYFGKFGWPSSTLQPSAPQGDDEQAKLIDTLQDWKTQHYQDLIGSGQVKPRPGVLRLMEQGRAAGLKLAVCSAATKSSVILVVEQLLGTEAFKALDVFMAGDDVPEKKPDPSIYVIAAERLGVDPSECLVIEDSTIGLRAALGAGMRCLITYTSSTAGEAFEGAERVFGDLPGSLTLDHLRAPPAQGTIADSRKEGHQLT